MAALNGISDPPPPHSVSAAAEATKPDRPEHPLPGEEQEHHR